MILSNEKSVKFKLVFLIFFKILLFLQSWLKKCYFFSDFRLCDRQRDTDRENDNRGEDDDEDEISLGKWPHALSPALACIGCTLGLFNISRFAILSIHFGGEFFINLNTFLYFGLLL